jgi:hypothetical protein
MKIKRPRKNLENTLSWIKESVRSYRRSMKNCHPRKKMLCKLSRRTEHHNRNLRHERRKHDPILIYLNVAKYC